MSVAHPWSFQSAWLSTYNWGSPEKHILSRQVPHKAFRLESLPHSSPKSSGHRFHNLSASGPLSTPWVSSQLTCWAQLLILWILESHRPLGERQAHVSLPTRKGVFCVHTDLLDDKQLHSWSRLCWAKGPEGALRVKSWHTGHSQAAEPGPVDSTTGICGLRTHPSQWVLSCQFS